MIQFQKPKLNWIELKTLWCVTKGEEGEEELGEFWFVAWFCNAQKTGNNPFKRSNQHTKQPHSNKPTFPLKPKHTGLSRTHLSSNKSFYFLVVVVWVCIQHLLISNQIIISQIPFILSSGQKIHCEPQHFIFLFIFSKLLSFPGLTNLINKSFSNSSTN